jgi:hypothetical protein
MKRDWVLFQKYAPYIADRIQNLKDPDKCPTMIGKYAPVGDGQGKRLKLPFASIVRGEMCRAMDWADKSHSNLLV